VHDERRKKVLDDMGFVWRLRAEPSAKEDTRGLTFDQLYSALVTYRQHVQNGKGAINIPNNFVVPDCDPWPQSVRGLPLGRRISSLRSKSFLSANPGAMQKLKAIGFQLDGKVAANDARFQLVYDALKRYQEIYGDLLVPQPFVVPERSKDWPEPTWGLRLGARVNAIRSQGTFVNSHPDRKELLDDLGFIWSPSESEHGSRRGRRRKEEMEEIAAKTRALEERSFRSAPDGDDDTFDDDALDSLFGDSFDFDQDTVAHLGEDSDSDSPKWGLEGGRRLEDAAKTAEEEAQAAEEYKPPKSLDESLAEAAERAAACGIIEKFG
jgi:Helicase associated domain